MKKLSLRAMSLKMMLYCFMVVSVLLVFLVDLYAGMTYCRQLDAQERAYTQQMLEDVVWQGERRLNIIADNLKGLSEKNSILSFLSMGNVQRMETAEYVCTLLDSYAETEPSVMALFLQGVDGVTVRGTSNSSAMENYELLKGYFEVTERVNMATPYRKARYERIYSSEAVCSGSDANLVAIQTPVFDMKYCGTLTALLDIAVLLENAAEEGQQLLLLWDGQPMWSNVPGLNLAGLEEIPQQLTVNGTVMEVYRANGSSIPWTLCKLVGQKSVYSSLREYIRSNMALVTCVLAIQGALLIVIYYWIVRQIENIARQMERIGVEGDEGMRAISVPNRSSNEIVVLARGINGMLQRVDTLNRQINQANIDYRDQHIMFLQLQINPHFLFNSLSSMRGMAAQRSWENVRDMTENLARIYRYAMDGGRMSTLEKEIEAIRWYANTFGIRYGEETEIRCAVDGVAAQCAIPRMILQPLAENAFLHSFAKIGFRGGMIGIEGIIEDGWLSVRLENDGPEVSDEVLMRMNGAEEIAQKHRGIGIVNVRRRIELLGGEGAGLTYEKRPGGGVTAQIRFPYRRM